MARHSLYPGFIRILYNSNSHDHTMVLPVVPALSGGFWTVAKVLGGVWNPWTDAVDALVLLLKPFFNTGDVINSAELYTLASAGATPVFVAAYSIGEAGTSVTADTEWNQAVFTWRTDVAGILKLYLMEANIGEDTRESFPTTIAAWDAIFNFATSSDGFIFGRDEGVPLAALHITSKENDKLRKKYLLNV